MLAIVRNKGVVLIQKKTLRMYFINGVWVYMKEFFLTSLTVGTAGGLGLITKNSGLSPNC